MDRNREARRIGGTTNGLAKRRQRNSSLRDSPEEDGAVELQETVRLRDRGNKKDRDRDRERDRLGRSKRRRGERLMHGSNREEGEDSSEESVDDDEEDEDEDAAMVRMLPPNPASSSSISNHHPQRKSFPPTKVIRAAVPMLKVADEMIGISVPRKARSASAKRSHECWVSGGGGGGDRDQIHHRQSSTSPARPSIPVSSSAPISPSSNSSVRKKMKSLGPKLRPPKMSKASSIQDDIEIEVAEVLFGLKRQPHSTSKQEVISNASEKLDLKDSTGTSNDVKSRVSSPISNSTSAAPQLPQNSNSSTAVAPKRKRPRPVKEEDDNSTIVAVRSVSSCSASKIGSERPEKVEVSSPKLKKNVGSERENGGVSFDLESSKAAVVSTESQPAADPVSSTISDSKPLTVEDGIRTKEDTSLTKYEAPCGKVEDDLKDAAATKPLSGTSEAMSKREEKYKIDLMASPPSKSSPDSDGLIDFAPEPKPAVPDVEMDQKTVPVLKNEERIDKSSKQDSGEVVSLVKRSVSAAEEFEPQKQNFTTEGVVSLQHDLEKQGLDCAVQGGKQEEPQKQQRQCKTSRSEPKAEKSARYTSLPLPMTVAGWPGALPPIGYTGQVPPLQGVTPLDGSVGSSNAIQPPLFPFLQPRPKKCATHYYIARTIHYHQQQFIRMNPFWPAAAGSAALCGTKPYNLNMVPSADNANVGNPMPGLFPGRVDPNAIQEKNQVSASVSNQASKEKSSVAANFMDNSQQRNQFVLQQQGSQPAAAGNLLHGPAFIFPLSQQQAAVAVATRSGPVKSGSTGGNAVLSSASNSAPGLQGKNSTTAAAASNMSFTYPNLAANEAQYLALLQNNSYPFPIPSHVGAPPPYRGTHAQAIPFFNGSFYSSHMLHPSHLQQQQPQTQSQPQPVQQGHQNTSTSTSSSSSHKHQQNQQQLLMGGGSNVAGNSHNFSTSKNRPQQQQVQQQQQNQNISIANQSRQHESDMDAEGSTSTVDGRVSHAHKNIYGQNFPLPIHAQNFALMAPAALVSGNHGEKQLQQQSLKGGMELIPSQAFAMSFASFSGAAPTSGIDFSSMVQNHAIFQSLPEATRQGYQIATAAAAAQAAQQRSSHQISEEGKTAGDTVNMDEDRKGMAGKGQTSVGHTLVFSRPDSSEQSASTVMGNTVIDSSNRTLNLVSAPVNVNSASRLSSVTTTGTASAAVNLANTQLQQQQQQQLIFQIQKQQQPIQQNQLQQQLAAVSTTRANKQSTTSSGNVFSDRLPSSSPMSSKLPNGLSAFPQGLIQGGSPTQSPQWKNSVRTTTSSAPSLMPATSSLKNISQQQGRTQQGHSQISFGVNSKSSTAHGQQQLPSANQSASPPMAVGSPTSVSKTSAGGSPRTTTVGSKVVPAPTLSMQQAKNSQSVPPRKSSPVGGRNVPSILGSSHVTTNANSGTKPQPQQQQHLHKQNLQQAHLFFSNAAYVQAQCLQSSTTPTTSTSSAYYNQRRQPEQQQQQQLHPVSSSSSTGMHCPPLAFSNSHSPTLDPAKAIAMTAGANGMKGVVPLHTSQFVTHSSAPFPYIHPVPALQVKPADPKQPAGNDNLHACWQPEKR